MFDGSKGVINDFDLSTIMDPGAPSPLQSGHERIGTKPFMALDLLTDRGYTGLYPRLYRHELESFSWVLLWASLCTNVIGYPFDEWLNQKHTVIYDKKSGIINSFAEFEPADSTPLYEWTKSTLEFWLKSWRTIHTSFTQRMRRRREGRNLEVDEEEKGCDLIRNLIMHMERNGLVLPIDDSWLDAQILHN